MRILIVEDETDLLRIAAKAFREEGYAVDEATDGEAGFSKATTWDYDAIILDIMLPRMDGCTLLTKLRRTKKTPVLLLTARDAIADRVKGLDAGADDYLVKPYSLAELLARVRSLIRRSANQPSPVLQVGDVSIDTAAKRVSLAGMDVELTAREYSLLELLVRQRGKVVTREKIYEHLFDERDDSFSNIVEVHISNLRKKLGKDLIDTRRGLGYAIDD